MRNIREEFNYLDGGSKVVMEIRNDRIYLTFSHSHKSGTFKAELDEAILHGKTDKEGYAALVNVSPLIGELVSLFDKIRSRT